jgi:hypothetical protein
VKVRVSRRTLRTSVTSADGSINWKLLIVSNAKSGQ